MARKQGASRSAGSSGGINIHIRPDVEKTIEELRQTRRDINAKVKMIQRGSAEKTILPIARRIAPRVTGTLASSLIIRGGGSPYITTSLRGKTAKYVGLQEFGGTVTAPIFPKSQKAVAFNGIARGAITRPRRYKAQRFMRRAVNTGAQSYANEVADRLTRLFPND